MVGGTAVLGSSIIELIMHHFIHYLTSGTVGLSLDMAAGFPDKGPFQVLFTQMVNIINILTGNSELISPINKVYYFSGINLTNVRTFFGTIAIYTNELQFIGTVVFLSLVSYLLKILAVKYNNIYVNVIYFYQCSLLCMGWFEYYFFHLDVIEVPVMVMIVWLIATIFRKTENKIEECV